MQWALHLLDNHLSWDKAAVLAALRTFCLEPSGAEDPLFLRLQNKFFQSTNRCWLWFIKWCFCRFIVRYRYCLLWIWLHVAGDLLAYLNYSSSSSICTAAPFVKENIRNYGERLKIASHRSCIRLKTRFCCTSIFTVFHCQFGLTTCVLLPIESKQGSADFTFPSPRSFLNLLFPIGVSGFVTAAASCAFIGLEMGTSLWFLLRLEDGSDISDGRRSSWILVASKSLGLL